MRVALVNTCTPFVRGGAEILVDDLKDQLELRGHEAVLFRVPFPSDYEVDLPNLALACRLLDFSSYDKVIAFKFPAYCVFHKDKTLWMFHQFRQVYDLYEKKDGLQKTPSTAALKTVIENIDNAWIDDAKKVFVNAGEVSNRLDKYNGILGVEVLSPPLLDYKKYHYESTGNYIYYPSRVTELKRQHMAVEAMKYTRSEVRLIVDGRCSEAYYDEMMNKLISDNQLEDKVVYKNEWVSNEDKINKYANCLGVIYIPYKEDSQGFVTNEAFYSKKPVISFTDSGGTKEFIASGSNGYLIAPDSKELAKKMDYLYENRDLAEQMGQKGYEDIMEMDITWDRTIGRLLQ